MRRANRYCLNRIQPKMSWHPANCYNLTRFQPPNDRNLDIFALQWKCKTLCRLYFNGDVTHRQFRRTFQTCGKNIYTTLQMMERRLDNVLFRGCLAPSVFRARNMVSSGHVFVNGERVKRP